MTESPKIDKSGWPRGPWSNEPDRVEFEAAGFPCLIVRQTILGHLCGYVAVPPGHPLHGVDCHGDAPVSAHGGLSYSESCAGSICHVPKHGEPDNVWWLGFDCSHAGDLSPGRGPQFSHERYRDVAYVRAEVESLAAQLRAFAP